MNVCLIDGAFEAFRHHYALPSARDPDGREIAAVRGVLRSVLGLQPGRTQPFKTIAGPVAFRVNYQKRR